MKSNQSFIGAYARSRRTTNAPEIASDISPVETSESSIPVSPLSPWNDPSAEQAILVTGSVGQQTQQWLEQAEGQMLRIDTPVVPFPVPAVDSAPEASAPEVTLEPDATVQPEITIKRDTATAGPPAERSTERVPGRFSEPTPDATKHQHSGPPAPTQRTLPAEPAVTKKSPAPPQPMSTATAAVNEMPRQPVKTPPLKMPAVETSVSETPAVKSHPAPLPHSQPTRPPEPTPPVRRWSGAAWEVDAFDIPQNVVDLFFNEAFFRTIAQHMGQSVRAGLGSVLVTSMTGGEGRTTVAIGTAIAAAASGLRVALIDLDLESPSLADQLRIEIEGDWVSAIRNGETLESVAVASLEDNLTLLPLTELGQRELPITAMEVDRLLGRLDGCFDLVMFDGPVFNSWATARIVSAADSGLIVRDARNTDPQAVADAAEQLRRHGIQGIGVVDNFVDLPNETISKA
ncbi:AAA family ATPase [Stieleria sp. TO1_6]|uniref:nucleotide-binding protein n=1 Tax=Stieleria tagensis TaxID=2956795 RepID=UPI00209AFDA9|nr:cellulose synthase operon protein YhjQ/BcsQ [Stieleria tagensis]MCO8123935.1 AAA family ATPase [Stieleria tagensis]